MPISATARRPCQEWRRPIGLLQSWGGTNTPARRRLSREEAGSVIRHNINDRLAFGPGESDTPKQSDHEECVFVCVAAFALRVRTTLRDEAHQRHGSHLRK